MNTPGKHPHQLTSNVKILQKVVLECQGRYLFLQREPASLSRPSCWDLPGGNSEWPSTITQPISNLHQLDAAREVHEETGLEVDPDLFDQPNLAYLETFFDPAKQIYTVLLGWRIPLTGEQPPVVLSDEHTAYNWVTPSEGLTLDFGGATGAFLPRLLQAASRLA